ncbi:fluoride efflux transporter FluC [Nonomuraea insulae]|uniref:Fluoride-specific ion channel n=1 Tax=Nonomuraea insulae TaxID=1616787 RepID=A0ABW1DCQ5_9ACTN
MHAMVERALAAGVPFGRVTADEAYGDNGPLRRFLESRQIGYVLAVSCSTSADHFSSEERSSDANVVGCLLMGLLTSELTKHPLHRQPVKMLLGTGFLGGFTTFSHLVDGVRELTVGGSPGWAAVYLVLSVVLGLLAVWAGIPLGRRLRWFSSWSSSSAA